jgi:hypothetical protein
VCRFFSAIVFRNGDIRWCETDSHEDIIERLGVDDAAPLQTRSWVRVECAPPHEWVRVDETSTPGWYDEDRPSIDGRVINLVLRMAPARKVYDEAVAPARKVYDEAVAAAQEAYDEAVAPARKVYDEAMAPARKVFGSIEGYVHLGDDT